MKRYLVPLDGSELADRVLPVLDRVVETGDLVYFLTVEEFLPEPQERGKVTTYHQGRMQVLDEHCRRLRDRGVKADASLRYGNAASTILEYAEQVRADAILMSSHGRSGLERLAYGSVALKVLSLFSGEVVLVRPPKALLRN